MDILTFLFSFSILSLPFGEALRWQLGNGISFTLTDVIVTGTALFYLLSNRNWKQYVIILPFMLAVLLSLLFNFSKLSSFQIFVSLLYPIRWFLYLQLFFIAKNLSFKKKQLVIKLLGISGFSLILLGFIQYFLYQNLRNLYYLGWDDHLYRMFSTILDPNYAGALFVLLFIFLLSQWFFAKSSRKYFLLILIAINLIAIFLTFSRSAILMLVASSFALLFMLKKTKAISILLGAIIIFYLINLNNFHVENINPFRIVSSEARLESAQIALNISQKNPIVGVGFNAYRYALLRYGYREGSNALVSHGDSSTDNSFLFVLATMGIIGLSAYFFFWKKIFKDLLGVVRGDINNRIFAIISISSIIGVFVDSFFINSLFFPFVLLWLWVVVGLAL